MALIKYIALGNAEGPQRRCGRCFRNLAERAFDQNSQGEYLGTCRICLVSDSLNITPGISI